MLEVLAEKLRLDPSSVLEARLELASRLLEEAKEYLDKGDPVQASEKIYKVVEECIKVLAEKHGIPEYRKALEEGGWRASLLSKASRRLARTLKEPRIESTGAIAYDVHVWGFHEAKLSVEDVREDIKHAERLLKYTREKTVKYSIPRQEAQEHRQ